MEFGNMSLISRALGTVAMVIIGYKLLQLLLALGGTLRRLAYIRRHLPGPPPHWIHGNIYDPGFSAPGMVWHQEAVDTYRRLLVFWVGWKPMVMLNHPDSIKELLGSTTGSVKAPMYQLFAEWAEGLGILEGAVWKIHRRLITPSFHFNVLKRYAVTMNRAADILINKLSALVESDQPLELHDTMTKFASDVILTCAFSHQSNCQEEESRYVQVIDDLTGIIVYRTYSPFLVYDAFFRLSSKHKEWKDGLRYMHGLQEKIITERRKKYEEQQESRSEGDVDERNVLDFLDTLLMARDSNGEGLSDKEIRDEVNIFILAGMDTTSSALTWLLYLLAKHPDYQTQLQEEVDQLFTGRDDKVDINFDELHSLSFVTQCIKESMRLYVYVPPYRLLTAPLKVNGFTIPSGTEVMVNNYQLHHNPDVWGEDHLDFKPSRFERENIAKRDPFAFVPFAAGHRNCIGQQFAMEEMQIATARILRRFSVSVVRGAEPVFKIVTKPDKEILLKLQPR